MVNPTPSQRMDTSLRPLELSMWRVLRRGRTDHQPRGLRVSVRGVGPGTPAAGGPERLAHAQPPGWPPFNENAWGVGEKLQTSKPNF